MNPWKYVSLALALGGCAASEAETPPTIAVAPAKFVTVATPKPTQRPTATSTPKPKPTPTVKPRQLKMGEATAKGLDESARRKVFGELVEAEDRAMKDAESSFSPVEESSNCLAEVDRLTAQYKADVARSHQLSKAQTQAIADEGLDNQWPPL